MPFFDGLHSIQGWIATKMHGVKQKWENNEEKAYMKADKNDATDQICLLTLDIKQVNHFGRHIAGKAFQSLVAQEQKLLEIITTPSSGNKNHLTD